MNYDLKTTIDKENKYKKWVDKVAKYLETTGPEIGTSCSVMQSRAVLDKDIDVVFLGCNANEPWGYCGVDRKRFWDGNSAFYNNDDYRNNHAMFHDPWKVWYIPYNALQWLKDTSPMDDGNYIFMNAIYFGTSDLKQMNNLPLINEAKKKCLSYTDEVIHKIFCPKLIVCFSIPDCFDVLNKQYDFKNIIEIIPNHPNPDYHCTQAVKVKSAEWKGCRVIGIPHPSKAISYDDWGAIGNFILQQYHEACK